jgi:high affinity Mn2+ porin
VELHQPTWALRYGAFLPPRLANGDNLPLRGSRSLSHNLELEERYTLWRRPGVVRVLGFFTRARMGVFHAALHATDNVNDAIARTRRYGRKKYGYVLNLEQAVTNGVGGFVRWSWNDGRTEDWAFTQIDRSLAGGVAITGERWGRPADTLGVAGALNALSHAHRRFLAAGGLGLIVGDGRLDYAPERLVEAYYAIQVLPVATVTLDYQWFPIPGYNRARGPVHVVGIRLHSEF